MSKNVRHSQEYIEEKLGPKIKMLSPYQGKAIKLNLQCFKCSHKFQRFFHSKHSINCPKCHVYPTRGVLKVSYEELYDRFQTLNIELIQWHHDREDKKNYLRCNDCQYEWFNWHDKTRPHCSNCKRIKKKEITRQATEKIITEVLKDKKIILLSDFVNRRHKIMLKCEICSHKWECYYTKTSTCPECRVPSGRLSKDQVEINFKNKNIYLLEWWVDRADKLNFVKCIVCDFEWYSTDKSGNRPGGCKKCNDNTLNHYHVAEDYKHAGIKLLSKYKSVKDYNDLACMKCNHHWKDTRFNFTQGYSKCPQCNEPYVEKMRREQREIIVENYLKGNIELLVYVSNKQKSRLVCHDCRYIWERRIPSTVKSISCPKCDTLRSNQEIFFKLKKQYAEKNIELIQSYRDRKDDKNEVKCLVCNYEWKQYRSNIKSGCPNCAKQAPLTRERLVKHYNRYNIELLSEKNFNAKRKVSLQCKKCGHKWDSIPRACGCPNCNVGGYYGNNRKNVMEEICRKIFEKITGEKFPKVRHPEIRNPKTNCRLELDGLSESGVAFEYQGPHHYIENVSYRNHKAFTLAEINRTKERDDIKRRRCKELGIKLIEIPYWIAEENLEDFIKKAI